MSESSSQSSDSYAAPVVTEPVSPHRVYFDIHARTIVKVMLVIAASWLALTMILELRSLLVQLSIAAFLAIAADPVVRRLERRGIGRGKGVLLVMSGAFVMLALAVAVFVPPLVDQGDRLIEAAPGIVGDVRDSSVYRQADERFNIVDRATAQAEKLPSLVGDQLTSVVGAVIAGVFGALTILFLTVFLLLGGGQVARGIVRLFPKLAEPRWWSVVQGTYGGVSAFVGGMIIIALLGGTSLAIVAALLGLPYALPLGLWMMMLEIIPMIGATIGAIPAVIVAFVAGGTLEGLVMIVFVIAYQQVENIVIQPKVQGRQAELSALVVFLAVLIGSQLLGVLGALFAVPLAGVLQIIARQIMEEQGSADLELPDLFAPAMPGDGLPLGTPMVPETGEPAGDDDQ
ncbi:MAG: AI-2E family transporter [Thermoleophilia bacterium]|nr:AI-2E family transporter [Thermoleophilia bacterium]